jgi:hypothetical protein
MTALFDISGTVTHPAHGAIATLTTIHIHRAPMRGQVHDLLDEESAELAEMSTTLMDSNGDFRPWLLKPGFRAGLDVCGNELNKGRIFYIQDLQVNGQVNNPARSLYWPSRSNMSI